MNSKKFLFFIVFSLVAIVAFNSTTLLGQKSIQHKPCKVELISCGWFSFETRQVCHQNGTGLDCNCGQSTTCS